MITEGGGNTKNFITLYVNVNDPLSFLLIGCLKLNITAICLVCKIYLLERISTHDRPMQPISQAHVRR